MKPKVMEINTKTNEIIVREMNDEEFAQYEIDQAAWEAEQVEEPTND